MQAIAGRAYSVADQRSASLGWHWIERCDGALCFRRRRHAVDAARRTRRWIMQRRGEDLHGANNDGSILAMLLFVSSCVEIDFHRRGNIYSTIYWARGDIDIYRPPWSRSPANFGGGSLFGCSFSPDSLAGSWRERCWRARFSTIPARKRKEDITRLIGTSLQRAAAAMKW